MTTYAKTGPFTSGAGPGVDAPFLNAQEDAVANAHTELHAHEAAAAPHSGHETPAGAQAKVDSHAAVTNPHSATAAATADRLALRDADGRTKFADPAAAADAATKNYVDGQIQGHDHTGGAEGPQISYAALTNKPKVRKAIQMAIAGNLSAGANKLAFDLEAFEDGTIVEVRGRGKGAGAGGSTTIDITVATVSIWADGANRLQLSAGAVQASTTTINNTAIVKGNRIQLDVDVAPGTPAADWIFYLIYEVTLT